MLYDPLLQQHELIDFFLISNQPTSSRPIFFAFTNVAMLLLVESGSTRYDGGSKKIWTIQISILMVEIPTCVESWYSRKLTRLNILQATAATHHKSRKSVQFTGLQAFFVVIRNPSTFSTC